MRSFFSARPPLLGARGPRARDVGVRRRHARLRPRHAREALRRRPERASPCSSDGRVRAGLTLGNVPLPDASAGLRGAPAARRQRARRDELNGKVIRVAGDQATVYADTKETGGHVARRSARTASSTPGTIPDGKIFKLIARQGRGPPRSPT